MCSLSIADERGEYIPVCGTYGYMRVSMHFYLNISFFFMQIDTRAVWICTEVIAIKAFLRSTLGNESILIKTPIRGLCAQLNTIIAIPFFYGINYFICIYCKK